MLTPTDPSSNGSVCLANEAQRSGPFPSLCTSKSSGVSPRIKKKPRGFLRGVGNRQIAKCVAEAHGVGVRGGWRCYSLPSVPPGGGPAALGREEQGAAHPASLLAPPQFIHNMAVCVCAGLPCPFVRRRCCIKLSSLTLGPFAAICPAQRLLHRIAEL